MADQSKNELINDILEDAKKEAGKALADAGQWSKERLESTDAQIRKIFEDARENAAQQTAAMEKTARSTVSVEKRRISLKVRDQMLQAVMSNVEKNFEAMIGTPGYREVLLGWIVEGVLGLGIEKIVVNASIRELEYIDAKMCRDVEKKIEELTGRKISVERSGEQPLIAQGVFLAAEDNSMAFNNQVHTRLLRYRSEIRKLIFDQLFADGEDSGVSGNKEEEK